MSGPYERRAQVGRRLLVAWRPARRWPEDDQVARHLLGLAEVYYEGAEFATAEAAAAWSLGATAAEWLEVERAFEALRRWRPGEARRLASGPAWVRFASWDDGERWLRECQRKEWTG